MLVTVKLNNARLHWVVKTWPGSPFSHQQVSGFDALGRLTSCSGCFQLTALHITGCGWRLAVILLNTARVVQFLHRWPVTNKIFKNNAFDLWECSRKISSQITCKKFMLSVRCVLGCTQYRLIVVHNIHCCFYRTRVYQMQPRNGQNS